MLTHDASSHPAHAESQDSPWTGRWRLVLGLLLLFPGLAGCLSGEPESTLGLPDQVPWQPAGEWEHVADAPSTLYSRFASTNDAVILALPSSSVERYIRIFAWTGESSAFEDIWRYDSRNGRFQLLAVAGVEDNVFVFISEGRGLGEVYRIHLPSGEASVEPKPVEDERSELTVWNNAYTVVHEGQIYIVGGCCGPGRIIRYDPGTHRFTLVAEIPEYAQFEHYTGAHTYQNRPFLAGDRIVLPWWDEKEANSTGFWGGRLLAWDLGEERWIKLPVRLPRLAGAVTSDGERLWMVELGCVMELDLDKRVGQMEAGVPVAEGRYPGRYAYEFLATSGIVWKSEFYVFTNSHPGDGLGSIWYWSPPNPDEWPYPFEKPEGKVRAGTECREEWTW